MKNEIIHVLIVEDEQVLRDVYETILSMQGYRVSTAKNGMEALSLLRHKTPDIILLDVLMPQMGGMEFMRNFNNEQYPLVRIIVNSNVSDLDVINEMLTMGAHTHVLKSELTPNALVDLIENYS